MSRAEDKAGRSDLWRIGGTDSAAYGAAMVGEEAYVTCVGRV